MEDSPLQFARPLWLYAAPFLCALLAWLLFLFDKRRESALALLVHPRFRTRLLPGHSPRLRLTKRLLWLLTLLLLCIAAAGPQKGFELREVKRRGIDILFAVDTSRSMLAEDLSPNRLERARLGIHDFINRLEGDRVGLIPFAGSAFPLCPLTSDYDAFRESLNALDTDIIPRQGTDVASAIREAQRLFDEQNNNHRILVLITDGEDLQGDALDAAEECAKKGMTIYPIGVGSTTGVTIPQRYPNGRTDFIRDETGVPVTTKLDESTLKKIAETTKGLYVPMGRSAEGLDTIYREKLRLVPKNDLEGRTQKIPLERYEWPLALAILLLVMEFLLPDRVRPLKSASLPSAARRTALPKATALLSLGFFLTSLPSSLQAQTTDPRELYNQGTAAYTAGDYAAAAETLRSSLHTPDLSLQKQAYYNLGNTLYRLGQAAQEKSPEETKKSWEESLKAYQDTLALDPNDSDAQYNHDLVKRKLDQIKEQHPDKDKKDGKDGKDGDKDKKDQEKKDGDKKDGEKKDGEQKDGEKKDEAGQKDGDKKEGQEGKDGKEDGGKKDEQATGKDGQKEDKDGDKTGQKPGDEKDREKKEGQEAKEGEDKNAKKDEKDAKSIAEERKVENRSMTKEEAQQLLQLMTREESNVSPIPQQPRRNSRDPANSTKGKTW
jgi:Ca-activated chloride channel family protein